MIHGRRDGVLGAGGALGRSAGLDRFVTDGIETSADGGCAYGVASRAASACTSSSHGCSWRNGSTSVVDFVVASTYFSTRTGDISSVFFSGRGSGRWSRKPRP